MNVGCNDNPLVDVRTGARHADRRLGRNFRILRVCVIAVYTCVCIHTYAYTRMHIATNRRFLTNRRQLR